MSELSTVIRPNALTLFEDKLEQAKQTASNAWSVNTHRAYDLGWQQWERWCAENQQTALPADGAALAVYANEIAQHYKMSTVQLKFAAIAHRHAQAGLELDRRALKLTLAGLKRSKGSMQRKAAAIKKEPLREVIDSMGNSLKAKRDKALLLLGWTAALRRSELVGLDVGAEQTAGSTGYVVFDERGLLTTLTSSKTDKEGAGQQIAVPYTHTRYCPVRAIKAWLEAASITEGAIFRQLHKSLRGAQRAVVRSSRLSMQSVRLIVNQRCVAAGVAKGVYRRDSAGYRRLVSAKLVGSDTPVSAHSLRSGFITSAAAADISLPAIQRQSRHKCLSVLIGYVRETQLWDENALINLDL